MDKEQKVRFYITFGLMLLICNIVVGCWGQGWIAILSVEAGLAAFIGLFYLLIKFNE